MVEQLGVAQLSKSQVSGMAQHLEAQVEAFRNRPLDAGPYTFVWMDALTVKVREGGRTVNVHALIAVGVGVGVTAVGKCWAWTSPRRRTEPVDWGSYQHDAASVQAQCGRVVEAIEARIPDVATHLDDAQDDLLAFAAFPHELWRQIWSNNPQERLNTQIRRRTDVVGIFPNRAAVIRLVGAVLAERTDEWTEQRRYMGIEILAKARLTLIDGQADTPTIEPTTAAIAA